METTTLHDVILLLAGAAVSGVVSLITFFIQRNKEDRHAREQWWYVSYPAVLSAFDRFVLDDSEENYRNLKTAIDAARIVASNNTCHTLNVIHDALTNGRDAEYIKLLIPAFIASARADFNRFDEINSLIRRSKLSE